jgi:hypothetical protein
MDDVQRSQRRRGIAEIALRGVSIIVGLFSPLIIWSVTFNQSHWGYYALALIPLALSAAIWPGFQGKVPRTIRLTCHGLLILLFLWWGVVGIATGMDDLNSATVRGVNGEWRTLVAIGVLLLAIALIHASALVAARAYRR